MKKKKKLALNKATLRKLTRDEIDHGGIQGGTSMFTTGCATNTCMVTVGGGGLGAREVVFDGSPFGEEVAQIGAWDGLVDRWQPRADGTARGFVGSSLLIAGET